MNQWNTIKSGDKYFIAWNPDYEEESFKAIFKTMKGFIKIVKKEKVGLK